MPSNAPTRPTLRGTFGMVGSTHWLASQAAFGMLERGGNAFDAAVAGGFVLHVVEPHLNGPGGDLPAVFATAADPTPVVLCGQGSAPAGATIEMYTSMRLDLIPGAGPLAAVIPGSVDAWLMLLHDHGTMPLADVLAPALGYARAGHPLLPAVGRTVAAVAGLFADHWPTSADRWLGGGAPPAPWQLWRNPSYANVLDRLIAAGAGASSRDAAIDAARREWREGFVADAIDRFQRLPFQDSSGSAHPGLVTGQDLANWRPNYEPALVGQFRDVAIAKTGPWGQGPVLLQTLRLLDGFGDASLDLDSAAGIHVAAEALKLAFADRDAWYGDDGRVPVAGLLGDRYTESRRALIGPDASRELRPGSPGDRAPVLPPVRLDAPQSASAAVGEPTVSLRGETRGDTCHIDVVDRWGNIISATPSGGWLQSSPHIPDLGFPMGSRAQMFWLTPGLNSSLIPGRRPRTTLSPTLVLREGVPVLACGTPGGDQQDQWQLGFLLRHLVGKADLQAAIDAPAFHTTSIIGSFYPRSVEPGGLVIEDRFGTDVLAELAARGHRVTAAGAWTLGRLSAVGRDPATGLLSAAANARGNQGYAAGR
ncbi:MAG: gamma-glutamyltransferase family protein [Jatrophihabitans sp.]